MASSKKASADKKEPPVLPIPAFLRDAVSARLDDQEGLAKYPNLHACLLPIYDEGKLVRPGGALSIKVEGAMYRVKLDLPFEVLQLVMGVGSLVDALERLEQRLGGPSPGFQPGFSGKKKKLTMMDAVVK